MKVFITVKYLCSVEGTSGSHNTAALWRQYYSSLFNRFKSDLYKTDSIRDDVWSSKLLTPIKPLIGSVIIKPMVLITLLLNT